MIIAYNQNYKIYFDKENSMEKYKKIIKDYSKKTYMYMTRQPQGQLKYPFIVPGSSSYNNCLWDWDSWLTNIAVRQIMADNNDCGNNFKEYEKGCIINFLESVKEDGRIPIMIASDETIPDFNKKTNIHKPCLAQHIAFIAEGDGETLDWLMPYMENLRAFIGYYIRECYHEPTGLFFWIDDVAIGVDNDPCTFYRPDESSASIYLNCLMYKELKAMEYICTKLNLSGDNYRMEAERLKTAINKHLWDERNGFYYSADINLKPVNPNEKMHSGMPRHWSSILQKCDSWSGFIALWAGVADEKQAKRIVYENMKNERLFWAKYGIRSLAKTEPMYCIVKSGNPSCWLGPVWGIVNYMCFRGLINYGFNEEARELAQKTVNLFGKDIEESGEMHEYYDPDTGAGVNNPGFQSWNLLVNNMIAWLETEKPVTEF